MCQKKITRQYWVNKRFKKTKTLKKMWTFTNNLVISPKKSAMVRPFKKYGETIFFCKAKQGDQVGN